MTVSQWLKFTDVSELKKKQKLLKKSPEL